jgi:hypothetical protein
MPPETGRREFLRFLVHTGVKPHWLLTGEGERYCIRPPGEIDLPEG